jgi:hypothetical protein
MPADVGLNVLRAMSLVSSTAYHGCIDRTRLAVPPLPSGLLQQLLVLVFGDLLSAPLKY